MTTLALNNERIRSWIAQQSLYPRKPEYKVAIAWIEEAFLALPIEVWQALQEYDASQGFSLYTQVRFYHYAVALDGSGPFDVYEFHHFLTLHEIYAVNLEEWEWSARMLVVGEDDWEEERIKVFLDSSLEEIASTGERLRVYSQEMFMFLIMTGVDPFDAPREVLEEFGRGHPVLDYLSTLGFDWPTCQSIATRYGEFETNSIGPDTGVLKRLGYRVGKNGIQSTAKRHQILERVFTSQLPQHLLIGLSASDLAEWGEPLSTQRLRKLANSLATFARTGQRRWTNNQLAIEHWKSDLAWLKTTFYTGYFRFQWPSTDD